MQLEERQARKILPNQVKMDKEYRKYISYRWSNNKKIMKDYYSSKSRDNKGLVKLTKEQFMQMYKKNKSLLNN